MCDLLCNECLSTFKKNKQGRCNKHGAVIEWHVQAAFHQSRMFICSPFRCLHVVAKREKVPSEPLENEEPQSVNNASTAWYQAHLWYVFLSGFVPSQRCRLLNQFASLVSYLQFSHLSHNCLPVNSSDPVWCGGCHFECITHKTGSGIFLSWDHFPWSYSQVRKTQLTISQYPVRLNVAWINFVFTGGQCVVYHVRIWQVSMHNLQCSITLHSGTIFEQSFHPKYSITYRVKRMKVFWCNKTCKSFRIGVCACACIRDLFYITIYSM